MKDGFRGNWKTDHIIIINKNAFFDGNKNISGGCQRVYYMSVMWNSIRNTDPMVIIEVNKMEKL